MSSASSSSSLPTSTTGSTSSSCGLRSSIWMSRSHSISSSRPSPRVEGYVGEFDVGVVGGGIVGVTTAYLLKKAGLKVVLIEGRRFGMGCTGFSTAKLSSNQTSIYSTLTKLHGKATAKLYGEMQEKAIQQAESIVNECKLDCSFERISHTTWTSDESKVAAIQKEAAEAKEYGLPAELIDTTDLPVSVGVKAAVEFKNQAQFNPYDFCVQLASKVAGDGSEIYENSFVTAVSNDSPHTITCESGRLQAKHVVLATHLPILDRSGHFAFLPPSRSHCIAVQLNQPKQLIQSMYINIDEPLRSLRPLNNEPNQDIFVLAGEKFQQGDVVETNKFYENLESWCRAHFDVRQIVDRWSAMDYFSSDHLPWSGYLYRGSSTLYTATGFSKWGLTNGIASAFIIRDLIQNEPNPYFEMVDARRWDLLKSGAGVVASSFHTAKHFIRDTVTANLTKKELKEVKKGEGSIVKLSSGHIAGAYLDDSGTYHIIKPVCTHLGCPLVFNCGDKAWDCPCHGSRFDVDGKILQGPACFNLKTIPQDEW